MRAPFLAALFATAACAAVFPRVARAQSPSNADAGAGDAAASANEPVTPPPTAEELAARERAARAYDRSHVYYSGGQYRLAITELENAIRIYPGAGEMYHELGLLYERIGQVDPAIRAYRHYLALTSDPAERERVERMIRRLDGARIEMYDIQVHHGVVDEYFWISSAAGVAGVAAGLVLLGLAQQSDNNADFLLRTAHPLTEVNAAHGTAETERTSSYVMLGIGGTFVLGAALLYFVRESPPRAVPVCVTTASGAPAGAGVLITF